MKKIVLSILLRGSVSIIGCSNNSEVKNTLPETNDSIQQSSKIKETIEVFSNVEEKRIVNSEDITAPNKERDNKRNAENQITNCTTI